MLTKRKEFWGTSVGLDRSGKSRRINIFKVGDGYDFVDENLDSRHADSARLQTKDQIRAELEAIYGLRDVKLEFPHLGIYSTSKGAAPAPTSRPAKANAAPPSSSGAWGKLLRMGRRSRSH